MKVYNFISLFIFLLFVGYAYPQNTKEFHEEIEVNSNAEVEIRNQFGNVTVVSWDENRVVLDILVTVKGKNQNKIESKLNEIDIDFELNKSKVVAHTRINEGWGISWFNSNNLTYQIDYEVKVPKNSPLTIKNDYGAIVINSTNAPVNISCDYGKLVLGDLHSDQNELHFDYTTNSTIDFIKGGHIYADYSGIEIAEAENIELQADYTNATFSTIQNLLFKNDYGKLTVHQVNEIEGEGDFLTLRIGDLYREIDLTHEFGSIKVTHIMPSTERVMINAEYTGIQLGIDPKWSFDYALDLEYASLKETLNLEPKIQRVESMRKYYNGTVGEYPIAKLTVTTEFGNLKLNPNP